MRYEREIDIKKAIIEIENLYPSDTIIVSYQDFLKERDYLHFYKFNPYVFQRLVDLANNLWSSKNKINRLSLLFTIKRYYAKSVLDASKKNATQTVSTINQDCKKDLFNIFRKTFEEPQFISKNQIEEARKMCNNILINMELTLIEESWLCENAEQSVLILNRILRYPVKSSIITKWAKANYRHPKYVSRRAEIVSWLIDEDHSFEVDEKTLRYDFDLLNVLDKNVISVYKDEIYANELIEKELDHYLPKVQSYNLLTGEYVDKIDLTRPELHLYKRPYSIPIDLNANMYINIPDFKKMEEEFYSSIDIHIKRTMMWAIFYSRIPNNTKANLYKKYYSEEVYSTAMKIAKKSKNVSFLKWMYANIGNN